MPYSLSHLPNPFIKVLQDQTDYRISECVICKVGTCYRFLYGLHLPFLGYGIRLDLEVRGIIKTGSSEFWLFGGSKSRAGREMMGQVWTAAATFFQQLMAEE